MSTDAVHDAVHALFTEVATAFGGRDLPRYRKCVGLPCLVVTPQGWQTLHDETEFYAFFTPMQERLKAMDFARSVYERLTMKQLDSGMVLTSMHWTRYRADGTPLETLGATYSLAQKDGRWQIVGLMVHAPAGVATIS